MRVQLCLLHFCFSFQYKLCCASCNNYINVCIHIIPFTIAQLKIIGCFSTCSVNTHIPLTASLQVGRIWNDNKNKIKCVHGSSLIYYCTGEESRHKCRLMNTSLIQQIHTNNTIQQAHMHAACTCHSTRVNSKITRDLVQLEMACNVGVQDSPVPQLNHEYCNPAIQS